MVIVSLSAAYESNPIRYGNYIDFQLVDAVDIDSRQGG